SSAISYPRAESVSATDHRSRRSSSMTNTQRRADFFAASRKSRGVSTVEVAVSANILCVRMFEDQKAGQRAERRGGAAGGQRAASASVTSDAMSWTSNGLLTTR